MTDKSNAKYILETLARSIPFSYPEPTEETKKILALTSAVKAYQEQLKKIFKSAKDNSTITAVVGRARSGKTHFLRNLEWRINEKKVYKAVTVMVNLKGEKIDLEYLIDKIFSSKRFIEEASKVGINITDNLNYDEKLKIINTFIEKIQTKYNNEVGIILIVDNFDEHLRQIKGKLIDNDKVKDEIERLLGVFRLIITEIPKGLVVIFSLTEDAREKIDKEFLKDPTLRGRFIFIHDERGRILTLSRITREEAMEIVRTYMEFWAKKENIALPVIKECIYGDDKNIFPFTPEAVELFLKAGEVAGYICFGCRDAIITKVLKYENKNNVKLKDLIVTKTDAARIIQLSASNWPAYKSVENEVRAIVTSDYIKSELENWVVTIGKVKYGEINSETFEDALREGFKYYLTKIVEIEGAIVKENVDIYDLYTSTDYKLHYIVMFEDDRKLGIILTKHGVIDENIGKPILSAILMGEITHGLFVYYGSRSFDPIRREKLPILAGEFNIKFKDYRKNIDYRPVIKALQIDEKAAWALVFLKDQDDEDVRKDTITYLGSNLNMAEKIKDLINKEPKRFSDYDDSEIIKPGTILDRSGA